MCPFFPSTLRLHPCSWGERTSSFLSEMFFHLITSIFLTEWTIFPNTPQEKWICHILLNTVITWCETSLKEPGAPNVPQRGHNPIRVGSYQMLATAHEIYKAILRCKHKLKLSFLSLQFMGRSLIPTHIQPSGDWRRPAASRVLQFV